MLSLKATGWRQLYTPIVAFMCTCLCARMDPQRDSAAARHPSILCPHPKNESCMARHNQINKLLEAIHLNPILFIIIQGPPGKHHQAACDLGHAWRLQRRTLRSCGVRLRGGRPRPVYCRQPCGGASQLRPLLQRQRTCAGRQQAACL